jgi:hypothetical protein
VHEDLNMENNIPTVAQKNRDDAYKPPRADDSLTLSMPTWVGVAIGLLLVVAIFGLIIYMDNQMPHSKEMWNRSIGVQRPDKYTLSNDAVCSFTFDNETGLFNSSCEK